MYRHIKWTRDPGICHGAKWINPKLDELQVYLYQINHQEQMRLYLHFCSNWWSIYVVFHLWCIFGACLAPRYTTKACRHVKPKTFDYSEAKALHPNSLSYLLKTTEKLVDTYNKDSVWKECPLHWN
jgi:hypothetical protein